MPTPSIPSTFTFSQPPSSPAHSRSNTNEPEEVLEIRFDGLDSRRASRLSARVPLREEEQAFLREAEGVQVTQEDRQSGYDTSLLSLEPRNSLAPTVTSSSTLQASRPFSDYTNASRESFYPDDEDDNDISPLSPRLPPPPPRPSSFASIPSISTSIPRRAAQGYATRAQASESNSKANLALAKSQSKFSSFDSAGTELEKGYSADATRPAGGKGGKTALWERKWLLVGIGALVVVVCVAIGVGAGVGVAQAHKRQRNVTATSSSTSSSSSSTSDVLSSDSLAPSPTDTVLPPFPSATGWSATASTTDWATVGASPTSTSLDHGSWNGGTTSAGGGGGYWGEDGQWHSQRRGR
ncbi:hypothetical protein JCM8097_002084 [Rhodosporidiobolus ruineniae]